MKKTIYTFILLCASFTALHAQVKPKPKTATPAPAASAHKMQPSVPDMPANPKVKLVFTKDVVNYCTIPHYSNGGRDFVFKNAGTEPLIITKCEGSCGCTVPTWPKKPIKPGETGVITVKYATDRVGAFEKEITVHSNSTTPTKVIKIKGVISAEPKTLPIGVQQYDNNK